MPLKIYPQSRADLCTSTKGHIPIQLSASVLAAEDDVTIAVQLLAGSNALHEIKKAVELQHESELATTQSVVLDIFTKADPKPVSNEEKEIYYAKRLQAAWKRHRARRKAAALKEKNKVIEDTCARLLQSRWRIRQAKARVLGLRKEKKILNERKSYDAALSIQGFIRCFLARL